MVRASDLGSELSDNDYVVFWSSLQASLAQENFLALAIGSISKCFLEAENPATMQLEHR